MPDAPAQVQLGEAAGVLDGPGQPPLRVDRTIAWQKGDAVNLVYQGKGPDIGAFEALAK